MLQEDDLRVIEEGLKPDDWVVSGGLLQVRPRMLIRPDRVPMSTFEKAPAQSQTKTKSAKAAPAKPPAVPVSQPIQREVTDYVDFTGRTKAVQSVDIRPRVTGYLVEMPFQEGAEVKKGDLLFVVDPPALQGPARPGSGPGQPLSGLAQAGQDDPRPRPGDQLPGRPARSASSNSTRSRPSSDEAEARVDAFEKSMEIYKLNHEFTRVISPIDGQISRYYLTLGNLVNQNQTLLTTVVSVDPMYAYFEMDEPTLLRDPQGGQRREDPGAQGSRQRCRSSWACRARTGSRTRGTINFVNNQVNPTTGSILVRGSVRRTPS